MHVGSVWALGFATSANDRDTDQTNVCRWILDLDRAAQADFSAQFAVLVSAADYLCVIWWRLRRLVLAFALAPGFAISARHASWRYCRRTLGSLVY